FFFFQAEDSIRDDLVTGVQTCALPIYVSRHLEEHTAGLRGRETFHRAPSEARCQPSKEQQRLRRVDVAAIHIDGEASTYPGDARSEERRVGKRVGGGGRRSMKIKIEIV